MKKNIITLLLFSFISVSFAEAQNERLELDPEIQRYLNKIRPDSTQKHIKELQNFGTRFALADNRKQIAEFLCHKYESYGCTVRIDSFFCDKDHYPMRWPLFSESIHNSWQYNVVAVYNNAPQEGAAVIIGAHYDNILWPISGDSLLVPYTYAPGADDNASGCAASLEIARVLHQNRVAVNFPLKFIAFAAEEFGLLGSKYYTDVADSLNEQVSLMINNDMIGSNYDSEGEWTLVCETYEGMDSVINYAGEIAKTYTTLNYNATRMYYSASDSYPFYLKGYPALFFREKILSPHYHSVSDIFQNIDMNYTCEAIRVSMGIILDKSNKTTGIETPKVSNDMTLSSNPNPVEHDFYLHFSVPQRQKVSLVVYDTYGLLVEEIMRDTWVEGIQHLKICAAHWQKGLYFCQLNTPTGPSVRKILKK